MKILIANLGSTSFKYRLFDMDQGKELARGGVERIGTAHSRVYATTVRGASEQQTAVADHAAALEACLRALTGPDVGILDSAKQLAAVGFKAVHAQGLSGVRKVDEGVLAAMEAYYAVAPAHNPPYVQAMRVLSQRFPWLPLVAAFETDFHRTIEPAYRYYAIPYEWAERYGIQRYGFHGASHRYIAERAAQLLGRSDLRLISCHLGGSSSLCALRHGRSVACSLGFSPQSGLPHNNRVGDFDVFALPALMRATGQSLEQILEILASRSGLLGLSGSSNDWRDLEAAASRGDARAQLALDVFVAAVRQYLGSYLLLLGGADAVVFTGGIGERSATTRERICADLDWFGIRLDSVRNRDIRGEGPIHEHGSRVQVWVIPTNEEWVIARQVRELLHSEAYDPSTRATG